MKNIIYFNQNDAEKFDYDRFKKSLNDYAKVPDADIKAALKTLDQYENLHVSRLVETGTALILKNGTEKAAKKYYDAHDQYFGDKFERLRRITGYLVGTLDRWNDGKKAEEAARVKHNVSVGQYDQATKVKREAKKAAQKAALGKE
jgi:hypothetical protein